MTNHKCIFNFMIPSFLRPAVIRFSFYLVFVGLSTTAVFAQGPKYVVLVSANMEWRAIKKLYPAAEYQTSVWGEFFYTEVGGQQVMFFHEGWGKVAAAGATQFVIDTYHPAYLINLGTCGGFEGTVDRLDIILADKTIIYDIKEAMGDSKEAIADYTTSLDLGWLGTGYPTPVIRTTLVSADKDLVPEELVQLQQDYKAVAGDWETGAIAYVAQRNHTKLLILRGVSDLVSTQRGEVYGNYELFIERAEAVMTKLVGILPLWIAHIEDGPSKD